MNARLFRLSAFVSALLTVGSVAAQPRPSETGPRRDRPPGQAGPMNRYGPGFDRVVDVLTDEQRVSLRDAMDSQRDLLRELEEKMRTTRRDLFLASLAEKFDEEAVRQKAIAAAKVEAEMAVMRIKAFSQVRPPLSPEQLQSIKSSFAASEGRSEAARRSTQPQRDENDLPAKGRSTAPTKK